MIILGENDYALMFHTWMNNECNFGIPSRFAISLMQLLLRKIQVTFKYDERIGIE